MWGGVQTISPMVSHGTSPYLGMHGYQVMLVSMVIS